MVLLFKILIVVWVYLSIGFGVTLGAQAISHKVEKMNEYYEWYVNLKLDPDDEDFGLSFAYSVIFWPLFFLACLIMLTEVGLKKLIRKIFEVMDKK